MNTEFDRLHFCPECKKALHTGQHKFPDGMFLVKYCKACGFREEVPAEEVIRPHKHKS